MYLILGLAIFTATFYLIVSEKIPTTIAALVGGFLMVMVKIISEHEALHAVADNLEIIFLLTGMMIIVNIISETGLFQWFAIKIAQLVKGEPFALMALLALVTGIFSAFLDNVTTILLMGPVSILLSQQLDLDPVPFLITEMFAANIGGGATLIGDPPNLLIATAAGFGFNDFLVHVAPLVIINMIVLIITIKFLFGRNLKVSRDLKARIMEMDADRVLRDRSLLIKSSVIFGLVIIGFVTNSITHIGLAVISMTGAMVLTLLAKKEPEEVFKEVEWETLFFFIGLFILVKGVEKVRVIDMIADQMLYLTQGNPKATTMSILWLSSFAPSILGAVPYTATFTKVIHAIIPAFPGFNTDIFWWALSLGACLGGNATLLGSAANVIGVGVATKSGNPISFFKFMKYGLLIVFQSAILSTIYIWIRYL